MLCVAGAIWTSFIDINLGAVLDDKLYFTEHVDQAVEATEQ